MGTDFPLPGESPGSAFMMCEGGGVMADSQSQNNGLAVPSFAHFRKYLEASLRA